MPQVISGFLENMKNGAEVVRNKILDLWEWNRAVVIASAALILLVLVLLISLAAAPRKEPAPVGEPLVLDVFLEYPGEPDFPDEYILEKSESKDTFDTENFFNDWFIPVDAELLDGLDPANRRIRDGILEAVP